MANGPLGAKYLAERGRAGVDSLASDDRARQSPGETGQGEGDNQAIV